MRRRRRADFEAKLADAIEADFHYLEPFLRQALKNLMKREHEEYATDDKDFWVVFLKHHPYRCRDSNQAHSAGFTRTPPAAAADPLPRMPTSRDASWCARTRKHLRPSSRQF